MNLLQRLNQVMQAVDYIQKEKKAGMNYTIVSHDAVTAKVRPELVKAGVVYFPTDIKYSQDGDRTQVHLKVRFCNIDDPLDYIEVEGLGYGVDKQDKGPGKAISYAVKYCLLKALGLETGDDADNESVDHTPQAVLDFEKAVEATTRVAELAEIDETAKPALREAYKTAPAKVLAARQKLEEKRKKLMGEPEKVVA